jgi:hypothetical protein
MSFRHPLTLGLVALWSLAAVATAETPKPEAAPSPAGPRLELATAPIDAGSHDRGALVKVTVPLKNIGTEPLTVEVGKVEHLRVLSTPGPIAPGQTGKLEVELDTLAADGESVWKVGIKTNDPTNPAVAVPITAKVTTYVVATPRELRWITIRGEGKATLKVTARALGEEPWSIKSATTTQPGIELTFAPGPRGEDGKISWVVSATLDPDQQLGAITGIVAIELDHPKQKRLRVPLSGFVRPAVTLALPDADYGTVSLAELKEKPLSLQLRYFTERPIEIGAITVTPPIFDASIGPRPDPRWGTILLTPNAAATAAGETFVDIQVTFAEGKADPLQGKLRVDLGP